MLQVAREMRGADFADRLELYVSHLALCLQLRGANAEIKILVSEDGAQYAVTESVSKSGFRRELTVSRDGVVKAVKDAVDRLTDMALKSERG